MKADIKLDTRGMSCPMPIIKTRKALQGMQKGQVIEVLADDPGALEDFPAFCEQTGDEFLGKEEIDEYFRFYIKKQ